MKKTIKTWQILLFLPFFMVASCGKGDPVEPEKDEQEIFKNNTFKVRFDAKNWEGKGVDATAALTRNDDNKPQMVVAASFDTEDSTYGMLFTLTDPSPSKTYMFDTDLGGDAVFAYTMIGNNQSETWLAPMRDDNGNGKTIGKLDIKEFDRNKNTFKATFSVQAYNIINGAQKSFSNGEIDVAFINAID